MPSHPGFARIASTAALVALAAVTPAAADTSVRAWTLEDPFRAYADNTRYRLVFRKATAFELSPPAPGGLVLRFAGSPPIWQWLAADVVTMTTAATRQRALWTGQLSSAVGNRVPSRGTPVLLTAATRATLMTAAFHTPVAGPVDIYGRIGVLRTDTRVLAEEAAPAGASHDFRESRNAPWVGFGLRYRVGDGDGDGPTVSAEYGAGDGLTHARIAIGWRF